MQILSRHQIGIPPTTFVRDRADVVPAIERVGGAPVVIKQLEGTKVSESFWRKLKKLLKPLSRRCKAPARTCSCRNLSLKAAVETFALLSSAIRLWQPCAAWLKAMSFAAMSTAAARPKLYGWMMPTVRPPCERLRSWVCASRVLICWNQAMAASHGGQQLARLGGHRGCYWT